MSHDIPLFAGQGLLQVAELVLAFALSALIGLERQVRGKSAGLRTQAIVGTASALFLLVSKYGFADVLGPNVTLDPSRVAAQVVSGIGFLGAGLILTRRGTVRGLTTAASVWETAAIGMAAGAGLWVLALVVTALHFTIVFGFTWINRWTSPKYSGPSLVEVTYRDGAGILRELLRLITRSGWHVTHAEPRHSDDGEASIRIEVDGRRGIEDLIAALSGVEDVHQVHIVLDDDLE